MRTEGQARSRGARRPDTNCSGLLGTVWVRRESYRDRSVNSRCKTGTPNPRAVSAATEVYQDLISSVCLCSGGRFIDAEMARTIGRGEIRTEPARILFLRPWITKGFPSSIAW